MVVVLCAISFVGNKGEGVVDDDDSLYPVNVIL